MKTRGHTIGNWRSVFPHSLISRIHLWCDSRPFAERPMTLTLRLSKSAARRETSASSVVQTGVKSSGCEKRMACYHGIILTNAEPGKRKIQANPGVTDPFVEPDATLSCLSFEIRGSTSKAKSRHDFSASTKAKIGEQSVKDGTLLINTGQGVIAPFSRHVLPDDAIILR
jgi:hypothetical protein